MATPKPSRSSSPRSPRATRFSPPCIVHRAAAGAKAPSAPAHPVIYMEQPDRPQPAPRRRARERHGHFVAVCAPAPRSTGSSSPWATIPSAAPPAQPCSTRTDAFGRIPALMIVMKFGGSRSSPPLPSKGCRDCVGAPRARTVVVVSAMEDYTVCWRSPPTRSRPPRRSVGTTPHLA